MMAPAQYLVRGLLGILCGIYMAASVHAQNIPEDSEREALELDTSCIINVLNRTVNVQEDGTWFLSNVPSNMGQIRARATCIRDGSTERGASDYFSIINNQFSSTTVIYKASSERVPTKLEFSSFGSNVYNINEDGTLTFRELNNLVFLSEIGQNYQAAVSAYYSDGVVSDVSNSESGINYISTNTNIVSVNSNGLLEAVSPGNVSIVARKDEVIAMLQINVNAGDDTDGDGLPDEYETANGLNPNDPVDAQEDIDNDGLTALEEFNAGTNIYQADTDSDGIDDREELIEGTDGFITSPVLFDSDGDLLPDLVEVTTGTDPNDIDDNDFEAAIVAIRSLPSTVAMTFNSIDSEVSTQLSITATLIDGNILDVTSTSFGTTYESDDLSIVSFGVTDGEIFGGSVGEANVTVSLFELNITVPVSVESFQPAGISSLTFTGVGNDTAVQGDYVYIAASSGGVHIVDVSDKDTPEIVASLTSASGAVDVNIAGDDLFVARGALGIDVFNVADKTNPQLIANYVTSGAATDLAYDNGLLYVANGNGGVEIIDVTDASMPIGLSVLDNLGLVISVDVDDDRAVVANSSSLTVIDVSDPNSPMRLGSINIGNIRAVVMRGDYAYVACYTCGYKVLNISDPMSPAIVGGDARFYPSDVELTNGLAFFSDILFANAVPFVNIFDPENSLFQGVIDIRQFGDLDAVGLSLDAGFVYSTGSNRLYISQYRMLNDTQGVAPTVNILDPLDGDVVVEGSKIRVRISAVDDIAVSEVRLTVNDELIRSDTTLPYEIPYTVADDVTALDIQVSAIDFGNNVGNDNVLVSVEPDADDDGLGDNEEVNTWLTDPNDPDSDSDDLNDGEEVRRGTNPLEKDTDSDGLEDGAEVANGTDPTNPDVTSPLVMGINPEIDAIDICENSSITVTFSEAMQRKSINAQNVRVLLASTEQVAAAGLSLQSSNSEVFINPVELLADNSEYIVELENVRDDAGNLLAASYSAGFTTGNCVDEERPFLVDSSPVTNSTDIAVNARITILLNEPIESSTVNEDNFYVYDQTSNQRINGVIEVTQDNTALVFTPNVPMLVGRRHFVIIGSTILDQFGNQFRSTSIAFTSSFEPDGAGPEIVSTTVNEGQTSVPTNAKLAVLFNEPINALYVNAVQLLDGNSEAVPVSRSLSQDRRRVLLTPTVPLDENTQYLFSVDGIQDLSGNLLATMSEFAFTTSDVSDIETGTLSTWSIPNNTRDVPLNPIIKVTMSEPIDVTTLYAATFYLYNNATRRPVKGSIELSNNNQTIEFIPEELLKEDDLYYLYSGYSPYLTDLAGNFVGQNGFRFFYTGIDNDETSPEVNVTNIVDGMTNIPVNSQILIELDSPLSEACIGANTSALTSGNEPVPFTTALTNDGTTLTFSTEGLAASTTYQLSLNGLCDYAGNVVTEQTISFTTSDTNEPDTTAPSLLEITPIQNSSDVSVTANIVMTFSENISLTSAPLVKGGGVTLSGSYTVQDNVLTFIPEYDFAGSTIYTIEIGYSISDFAGNNRWLSTSKFTTQNVQDTNSPNLTAISPANGSSDINPSQDIVLRFNEPVNPDTLNANNVALYSNGTRLTTSIFRSADGRDLTLSAIMPQNALVSVVMTADVSDLSGNRITPFISSFSTGENDDNIKRPTIVKQVPLNGSSGWTDLNEVYFYTDEILDQSTLEDGFRLAQNGVILNTEIESLGDGRTIRVTTDTNFANNALIQLYWDADATDIYGNPLNSYQQFFNTGDSSEGIGRRARVIAYSPNNSNLDVPLNAVLRVAFDEAINEATLSNDNVKLYDITAGQTILDIETSVDASGEIVLVRPLNELVPDNRYYLELSSSILDTDGDNLQFDAATFFNTSVDSISDDRPPQLVMFSPPEGAIGVGTLPQFSLQSDEPVNPLSFSQPSAYNMQFSENNTIAKYQYFVPFDAGASVQEQSPYLEDFAANAMQASAVNFATASGPDLSPPAVVDSSLIANQINVAVNKNIDINFNEPIDQNTVLASGVYIFDTVDSKIVESSVELSADGLQLSVTPVNALLSGRRYYLYAVNLRDLSANTLPAIFSYFTTGFEEDNEAPFVVSSTVIESQINVPINARFNVRFNETISTIDVNGVQLYDAGDQPVLFSWTLSRNRQLLTIVPKQLLQTMSNYRIVVEDQKDSSQNAQIEALDVSFTTGGSADLVKGELTSWNLPANRLIIPINPLLTATFDEAVDPATIDADSSYLFDIKAGIRVPAGWSLSDDRLTLTIVPDENLRPLHSYYWYLGYAPNVTDYAGNLVAQNKFLLFETSDKIDSLGPTVESFNIDDGDTNMPINARVRIDFDEAIGNVCLQNNTISVNDGVNTVDVTLTIANNNETLFITATNNWLANTSYTVAIDGLCDYAGNIMAAQELNFTTLNETSPDVTQPAFVSMNPVNNSTDISVDLSSIVMTFSKTIDKTSKPPISDGQIIVPGTYTVDNNQITFVPAITLRGDTRYSVLIERYVADLVGNTPYLGIKYFTTEAADDSQSPTILGISPMANSSGNDPGQSVVITFDEPINNATLIGSTTDSSIALYANGSVIRPSLLRSSDGTQVTINASLPANALVSVVVTDTVEDISGNKLSPFISSFTTSGFADEATRPRVSSVIPQNGSTGWIDLNSFVVFFSEAMDAQSLEDSLRVTENGVSVEVEIEVTGNNRILTVTKNGGFAENARVTMYLDAIANDIVGNTLFDYTGYFVMGVGGDRVGTRPRLTAYHPVSNTPNVPLNAILSAMFEEPLDIASINDTNITLYDVTAGWTQLNKSISLSESGQVIQVLPNELLVQDNVYNISYGSTILDTDGDSIASTYSTFFRTAIDAVDDDSQPTVLSMSPPDGQQGLGVNTRLSVLFDESMNPISLNDQDGDRVNVQFSTDNKHLTYTKRLPYAINTDITESINSITDTAGNAIDAISTNFTTGNGPDLTNPALVDVSLVANQQLVPTNPVIRWVFDEPIDPVSLMQTGVYIYNNTTRATVPSTYEISGDGKQITLIPNEILASENQFFAYALFLRDLSGNPSPNFSRFFTTAQDLDLISPTITAMSVINDQVDVPINLRLNLRFSESLNPLFTAGITMSDDLDNAVAVNTLLSRDRKLLTIVPKALLSPNSVYSFTVSGVKDLSDNELANDSVVNFTTGDSGDFSPSTIAAWNIPVNNTQNVPLNTLISVDFSEQIDRATIDENTFYLQNRTTNSKVAGAWSLTSNGLSLRFTPDALLDANTRYDWYVGYSPYLNDLSGNRIATNSYRYFVTGTEEDTAALNIDSVSVPNGTDAMPINGRIVLAMSKPLSGICPVSSNIRLSSGNVNVPANIVLASDRQTVTIKGVSDFLPNTSYTLNIDTLCDYTGNTVSGLDLLSFTTSQSDNRDNSGPTLTSIDPVDGSVDVAASSSIVMVFSETLDLTSRPVIKQGAMIIDGSYEIVDETITFTPNEAFTAQTTYTVELNRNFFDLAGNSRSISNNTFTIE